MNSQPEIVLSLEVPLTDAPDDVTAFVRQLQQSLRPGEDVVLELETVGTRRYLRLVRAPLAAPSSSD